ncbi:putative sodium-dependent multivitamin transporter [Galendromus occidentalis]|uniref:Sodium-dependent multivitamin transporter n=1 Tax=Galendromus occidentalis TaxID=34638 RepID=A0AAJ7L5I0_9ACAR|nr:putative sodium-dependent multivitamin transporter [Galendromus occidentalis]
MSAPDSTTLGPLDFSVLGLTLIISAGIGIYYRFSGGRQRTAKEYLIADGNMSVLPVAFSLMASFMSAVTLLGVPKENYFHGTEFFIINIAYIIGTPIVCFVFLPVFYRLQTVSVYGYLEKRFGRPTRLLSSGIFIVQMVFYMSVVLYAPAVTLQAVTRLSRWYSIISVGIVCTFYCTIGGMKAVLWTDLFQSCLMFASMFAVLIAGTYRLGGLSNVMHEVIEGGRFNYGSFSFDPEERHTIWSLVFGGLFVYMSLYGVNQAQIQRLLSVKTLAQAQKAMFIQWPILTMLSFTSCFTGLVIYANFRGCDPYVTGKIQYPDQILPYFVMKYLGGIPALPGLFIAGIFSGALSTVSSAINSLAAVTFEDFVRPMYKEGTAHEGLLIKTIALFYGVICVLLTGIAERLGGVLQASFVFFGVGGGPLLGVFTLGMLSRRTGQKAALSGIVSGLLFGLWIGAGALFEAAKPNMLPLDNQRCPEELVVRNATLILSKSCSWYLPLCNISYQWYTFAAWLPTVLVGLLASLVWPNKLPDVELYLSPILKPEVSCGKESPTLRMRL